MLFFTSTYRYYTSVTHTRYNVSDKVGTYIHTYRLVQEKYTYIYLPHEYRSQYLVKELIFAIIVTPMPSGRG